MRSRVLGRTGMTVSTYCLGAMMFGPMGNADESECAKIIGAALDTGINFIDTADVYSDGTSEQIIGRAIAHRRDEVVLSTKFGMPRGSGSSNRWGGSRRWVMQAVEASLRRLGTDWIDVLLMHRPDPNTPIDETLGALSALVDQGKLRAIGTSTFPAEALVDAHWTAQTRGHQLFGVEQPPYSIFMRSIERDVLPTTRRLDIATMVWSPLAGGWLTGKYRRAAGAERLEPTGVPSRYDLARPENQRKLDLVEDLVAIASGAGMSLTHLALAWVLEHPGVTAAIIGPKTVAQYEDLAGAFDVGPLPEDVLDAVDAVVAPGADVDPGDRFEMLPGMARAERRRR